MLYLSLIVMMLFSCVHQCAIQGEGALLVFEENSYDFGEIKSGEVVSHVFKFQNCGSDTLRIKRVRGT
jgi:hypothetical protein